MLPHLRDRLITLTRYPNGIGDLHFYQKHSEGPPPDFVETVPVHSEGASGDRDFLLCNNLATLLWLGQLANLEFHATMARVSPEPDARGLPATFTASRANVEASVLNYPDFLLFDLDPYIYRGDEAAGEEPQLNRKAFTKTVEVARAFKEILDAAALPSYVKTSGATGLHIYVPVLRQFPYPVIRSLCETVSGELLARMPQDVTLEWASEKRTGKIFLDVNQNARAKNVAAIFSPRAKPGAPVSVPVRWDELDDLYPTDFTVLHRARTLRPDRRPVGRHPRRQAGPHRTPRTRTMSQPRDFALRGRDRAEAIEIVQRALVDAGYEAGDCVDVLGGAFVSAAVRRYWAEGLSAAEAHERLCAEDPELARAIEALAPLLLDRVEARGQQEAAVAAVELLLAGAAPDRDQLRLPLSPDAP